jgi:hypothetical protein
MTATSFFHWPQLLAKLAAMAAAYYVVGRLGLLLAIPPRGMPRLCGQHPALL